MLSLIKNPWTWLVIWVCGLIWSMVVANLMATVVIYGVGYIVVIMIAWYVVGVLATGDSERTDRLLGL